MNALRPNDFVVFGRGSSPRRVTKTRNPQVSMTCGFFLRPQRFAEFLILLIFCSFVLKKSDLANEIADEIADEITRKLFAQSTHRFFELPQSVLPS